ncbi:hypothetical protein [Prochlorothrix hollandica]|nr:hypothetical protein [Prochlorothrix hollandica]
MRSTHKILFFTPYAGWDIHTQVDMVLAKALELRQCQCLTVLCDGLYQYCHLTNRSGKYTQADCNACAEYGVKSFSEILIPFIQLRNYISESDWRIGSDWVETLNIEDYPSAEYNGVPIGSWIISSIYTYFTISTQQSLQDPKVQKVHRQYLIDGLVTYIAFSRLIYEHKPDHLVLFNGRIAPYRIAFEVAQAQGISTTCHERGFLAETFSFFENQTCLSIASGLTGVSYWSDIALSAQQLTDTKRYLSNREVGKELAYPSFYSKNDTHTDIRKRLNIPQSQKIVCIFTSSEDELASSEEYLDLQNQLTIIQRLINIFRKRDECLVIRHHPRIASMTHGIPDYTFINRAYTQAFSDLPSNVRIVMPQEPLTVYSLFWHVDLVIALISTVAIEALTRGIKTITLNSSSYSSVASSTFSTQTSEVKINAIIDKLLESSKTIDIDSISKSYRFAHAFFIQSSRKFKSFGTVDTHRSNIRIKNWLELNPGIDPTLDQICNHIIYKDNLYILPNAEDNARSRTEEEYFFRQELQRIQTYRSKVQATCLNTLHSNLAVINVATRSSQAQSSSHLNSWLKNSRHYPIQKEELLISNNWQHDIEKLIDSIENCKFSYILVTNQNFEYDPSFVIYALNYCQTHQSCVVTSEAWIRDIDRQIKSHRKIYQVNKTDDLEFIYSHPLMMLGFFIFEKKLLLEFLQEIKIIKDSKELTVKVIHYFKNPFIYTLPFPAIIVQTPVKHYPEAYFLSLLSQTQDQLSQTQDQLSQTQDQLITLNRNYQDIQEEYQKLTRLAHEALLELASIKSSNFWKIRSIWFRLRKIMTR